MHSYIANFESIAIHIKQVGADWYAFPIGGGTCIFRGRTHDELWEKINGKGENQ